MSLIEGYEFILAKGKFIKSKLRLCFPNHY